MSPGLLLSLWRARWGKPDTAKAPYAQGKVSDWVNRLTRISIWNVTGMEGAAYIAYAVFFILFLPVQFVQNGQAAFSTLLIVAALFLRRYTGLVPTMALLAMSLFVSARYFYWRTGSTLGDYLNWAFLAGFFLVVAEFHRSLLSFLASLQAVWQIRLEGQEFTEDATRWPTVDVLIPCQGQPLSQIIASAESAATLGWPRKKLNLVLLDGLHREDVKALADSVGARYLSELGSHLDSTGLINEALPETEGELIAILECGSRFDPAILSLTVPWFANDQRLSLLETPGHPLISRDGQRLPPDFSSDAPERSFALVRRSMLTAVGGLPAPVAELKTSLAQSLQKLGHSTAFLGFSRATAASDTTQSGVERGVGDTDFQVFRVDQRFVGRAFTVRMAVSSLYKALRFYGQWPRLYFFAAPLPYLLAGVSIIHASPEIFAAYVLPHWLHAHIARARTQGVGRYTELVGIWHSVLSCYMLLPTARSWVQTVWGRVTAFLCGREMPKKPTFNRFVLAGFCLLLVLNLIGLGAGIWRAGPGPSQTEALLYLAWALSNVLILAAIAAVAEETRQIRHHQNNLLRQPVILALPMGRSLACETENFPSPAMSIWLPSPVALAEGSALRLSMVRGRQEFTISVYVEQLLGQRLTVRIADPAATDFQDMVRGFQSRGEDWPKWLPHREADQPLPKWLTGGLLAAFDFCVNLTKHLSLASLTQLWKK